MRADLIDLKCFKAKKLKKQLLLCYKAMQLNPDKNYLNIIYDDEYGDKQRQADGIVAKERETSFTKSVFSKNAIEFFLYEHHFSDSTTYRKFNSVREYLIYATDQAVSSYTAWYCYQSSKDNYIDLNVIGGAAYGDFMRKCRENLEQTFSQRRETFFKSNKFQELIRHPSQ